MSILMPAYHFNRITDITAEDFRRMGVKAAALDVDNTLKTPQLPGAAGGCAGMAEGNAGGRYTHADCFK